MHKYKYTGEQTQLLAISETKATQMFRVINTCLKKDQQIWPGNDPSPPVPKFPGLCYLSNSNTQIPV